ncbi:MAG: hypothetical protein ACYDC1_04275 [Limisphaerales bacterium]
MASRPQNHPPSRTPAGHGRGWASAVVLALTVWLLPAGCSRSGLEGVNTDRILAVAQAYHQQQTSQGRPPEPMRIQEFVREGLLTDHDIRGFAGADVTVYPLPRGPTSTNLLMRARMPDGRRLVILANGRVQNVP